MKCEECIQLLSEYADGELSPAKSAEVEEHIGKCDKCRAYLDNICMIKSEISDMNVDVPSQLHDRILKTINEERSKKIVNISFLRSKAFGWVIAACFLCVIAVSFIPGFFDVNTKGTPELFEGSKRDSIAYSDMAADAPEECVDLPAIAPESPDAPSAPNMVYPTDEEETSKVKFVFKGNGEMPEYLDAYNPKYNGKEIYVFFEYADKAVDFASILKLQGFVSGEDIELSETAENVLADNTNVIIIVLE